MLVVLFLCCFSVGLIWLFLVSELEGLRISFLLFFKFFSIFIVRLKLWFSLIFFRCILFCLFMVVISELLCWNMSVLVVISSVLLGFNGSFICMKVLGSSVLLVLESVILICIECVVVLMELVVCVILFLNLCLCSLDWVIVICWLGLIRLV